jgi:acyl-CoA reductase-like NAD-dependent aldehyde dehydrogenase
MTINGQQVPGDGTFDVIDPATGAVFAQAPSCSREQLDDAFGSALAAFGSWRRDESARRAALVQCSEALKGAADELVPLLTQEQGKPLAEARTELAILAGAWFRYIAKLELPAEILQDNERARVEIVRRPLGVVAAITPWNVPVGLAVWKIAPALLAGNTMVVKPSPYTPLSTLRMIEVLNRVLPPGVLNVVSGPDPLGQWMTEHPIPRKISFTGSTATGKRIAASAADDLKRVTLELGGNDPAIVLPDADLAKALPAIFTSGFTNAGQVCVAIKRVYAHESVYSEVVEGLVAAASAARLGNGLTDGTTMGPLNNRPQLDRVSGLVEDAAGRGAKVISASKAETDAGGYFYAPTILADATDGMAIVDEEQFGPAMPVIRYSDIDDVIAASNAGHFGLGASVWTSDLDRGTDIARQFDAGSSWVNVHGMLAPYLPFGGLKWSGLGVENGPWGYYSFTEIQTLYTAR